MARESSLSALPAAAEMVASLHIARTGSSVLDTVFVCRAQASQDPPAAEGVLLPALRNDVAALHAAGVRVRAGEVRCLAAGHLARLAVARLRRDWDPGAPLSVRIDRAREALHALERGTDLTQMVAELAGGRRRRQTARREPGEALSSRGHE